MEWIWGLLWAISKPGIISALCAGVVLLVINFIFPDRIPNIISKLRWVIAIIVMIIIIIISTLIKADMKVTPMVAGFTAFFLASYLKSVDEKKE